MKMRKIAALVLTAAMVLSSAMCVHAEITTAGVDPANTEVTDETLRIVMGSEPSTLWGAAAGQVENESQLVLNALMDRLVDVDYETNTVLPKLATAWEWVDDTHCRFTLRDDVTMTDGTPLVADDVVYTVGVWTEYSANTDTGRFIAGAEAEDEHTVVIEFNQKAPDLLSMLSWSNFGIASEDEVNAAGGLDAIQKAPVMGCGRYIFKDWTSGQSITLERNDNYWDPDYKGYFKNIVLTFTNDTAAREMAVESGDAQVAIDEPVIQSTAYGAGDNVKAVIYDYGQVAHLWFNMLEGRPTADVKVREAIAKAINYEALANVGTGGAATVSLGYLSPASPYYNELDTMEEKVQDIEGAKALLAEAGYPDGLDLEILGGLDQVTLLTVIQENLRNIGINLTLNTPDTAQFVGDAFGGNYDITVVGEYIPNRNPSAYVFVNQDAIDSGFVIGGPKVTTPEMNDLVHEIIAEEDNDVAKEKMAQLEQLMKDDYIQVNLYPELKSGVIAKDLKGYNLIERGFLDITGFYY
jgi:peptide/nickel transport system substrate-binding protein